MNPADIHACTYQCDRPICIRRQRDELYTAILLQEPGFTAADMADQYATAFERGRESVLAEQAAAAQKAVAWTVVGPDGKSSIGGWQDMKTHDFWKEAGVLREGHRYAYACAAPVAAAPEGFVMVPVEPTEDMLMFMGGHDDAAARRAYASMLAARPQGVK